MTLNEFVFLQDELIKHASLYYVEDNPIIPDEEYDALFHKVKAAEQKFPNAVKPNSPTRNVGGKLAGFLQKVKHQHPMLSLGNLFDDSHLQTFLKTCDSKKYYCDQKMDGLAISVIYEFGIYKQAVTRGKGGEGEDVTHSVRGILNLPMKLPEMVAVPRFEVRGEACMTIAAWAANNRRAKKDPKVKALVNCRNGVAGAIRTLKTDLATKRGVKFFAYNCFPKYKDSVSETRSDLKRMGFECPAGELLLPIEIPDFYKKMLEERTELEYDIDGMVIMANEYSDHERLGYTNREPRFGTSYKFPAAKKWTPLLEVAYQTGRTGVVTPVAIVSPVFVGGVTYNNITLHNAKEIQRLGLRENCMVLIERRGDVIPKIVDVEGGDEPIQFTRHCPSCNHEIVRMGEIMEFCQNPTCPDQIVFRLSHACSRLALNINGLSEKRIKRMLGILPELQISDLFGMTKEFCMKAGIGIKDSEKITAECIKARKTTLSRYIYALGIKEVGESTAAMLAAQYKSMDNLMRASREELMDLPDVGEVIADNIVKFLNSDRYRKEYAQCLLNGIELQHKESMLEKKLEGKSVCVTGSFARMGRSEIKQLIRDLGGNPTGSVSGNTYLLVAGEKAGSKLAKANQLGVTVYDEEMFLNFVGD